jgi:hypothetical protein
VRYICDIDDDYVLDEESVQKTNITTMTTKTKTKPPGAPSVIIFGSTEGHTGGERDREKQKNKRRQKVRERKEKREERTTNNKREGVRRRLDDMEVGGLPPPPAVKDRHH